MKSIGGYFELELNRGNLLHSGALKLNTARNALQLLIKSITCSKVYLPYYTCDVVIDSFVKMKIPFSFYNINMDLEPELDYSLIKRDEYVLYTNYFGLKDDFIGVMRQNFPRLIIDNSQSFYSKPLANVPTFYSARKFFGVPDGAYLYSDVSIPEYNKLKTGSSYSRFDFLIKSIDLSVEAGYLDFQMAEKSLNALPIEKMSKLSEKILKSINYEQVAEKRRLNFSRLSKALDTHNEYDIKWNGSQTPLVYPFLTQQSDLKSKLIKKRIYTASYWPDVINRVCETSVEFFLTSNFIFLPIDQRYSIEDMDYIIKVLTDEY